MFKRILATLTTVLLGAGLSLVAVAAPASAHNANLSGVAACQPDGTWSVTWTYTQTNTPSSGNGSEADVKIIKHEPDPSLVDGVAGQLWINAWTEHANSNGQTGIPTRTGNWTQTFVQSGIPGTATKATVMVQTDWKGWQSVDIEKTVKFSGSCDQPGDPVTVSAVPHVTDPTCDVDGKLVIEPQAGVTWSGGQNGAGPGTYTLVAAAADGYVLTEPFSITLTVKAATGDCPPPPPTCLDGSSVSYTYDAATNSGVVTVNPDADYPVLTELCTSFWVTATSWTFIKGDSVWPQALDQVQYLPLITSVGSYPYSAPVECGQGDIYAQWYQPDVAGFGQPIPPSQLNGPSDPWAEHFLHDMDGFTGPNPTYMQDPAGCNSDVTPGEPVAAPEECTATDTTPGSITVMPSPGKIAYTITGGPNDVTIDVADDAPKTELPAGDYVVTAHGVNGFKVGPDNTWAYPITVGESEGCEILSPTASQQGGSCTALPTFTLSDTTSKHGGVQWQQKDGDSFENIAPGAHTAGWGSTVVVKATLVDPEHDGFAPEQKTEWSFTFPGKPACGDLTTLALTGTAGGPVLWIAGALLLLGGAGIYFARRKLAATK